MGLHAYFSNLTCRYRHRPSACGRKFLSVSFHLARGGFASTILRSVNCYQVWLLQPEYLFISVSAATCYACIALTGKVPNFHSFDIGCWLSSKRSFAMAEICRYTFTSVYIAAIVVCTVANSFMMLSPRLLILFSLCADRVPNFYRSC